MFPMWMLTLHRGFANFYRIVSHKIRLTTIMHETIERAFTKAEEERLDLGDMQGS
jgi:hypothetical protein